MKDIKLRPDDMQDTADIIDKYQHMSEAELEALHYAEVADGLVEADKVLAEIELRLADLDDFLDSRVEVLERAIHDRDHGATPLLRADGLTRRNETVNMIITAERQVKNLEALKLILLKCKRELRHLAPVS